MLKCACEGSHRIQYWQFKQVSRFIRPEVIEQFNNAKRRGELRSEMVVNKLCPYCNFENIVYPKQQNYQCRNLRCGIQGIDICVEHNTYHQRGNDNSEKITEIFRQPDTMHWKNLVNPNETFIPGYSQKSRACQLCLKAVNGDVKVNYLLSNLRDKLNDKCPSCNNIIGQFYIFKTL